MFLQLFFIRYLKQFYNDYFQNKAIPVYCDIVKYHLKQNWNNSDVNLMKIFESLILFGKQRKESLWYQILYKIAVEEFNLKRIF